MLNLMEGIPVRFGEYESQLCTVLGGDCYTIDFPKKEGKAVMLPRFAQYDFYFYIEETTCLCAKGQIISRYCSKNREVVEIELMEGLCQKDVYHGGKIVSDTVENLQKIVGEM